MKTITKGKVVAEVFSDIFEYRRTLASRPLNNIWQGRIEASKGTDYSFYHTNTFEEANDLMFSYSEGMEQINRVAPNFKREEPICRNRQSVIGTIPNVAAFLKGHPLNMMYREKIRQEVKQINLYYDRGQYSGVSTKVILCSGRKLLDAVRMLEASGVQVAIYIMDASVTDHQVAIPIVKLKDASQPLNILKMAYSLVHPSFNRRHTFRWLETSPIVTDRSFVSCYGGTLSRIGYSLTIRRDFLIDNGVMMQHDVLIDCATLNGLSTADELVKLLEKQMQKSLEQVHRAI